MYKLEKIYKYNTKRISRLSKRITRLAFIRGKLKEQNVQISVVLENLNHETR